MVPTREVSASQGGSAAGGGQTGADGTVQTSAASMQVEEAARASGFGKVLAMLCACALVLLLFLEGTGWLKLGFGMSLIALCWVSLWISYIARSREHVSVIWFRVFGLAAVTTSGFALYYLGVFSPTALAVTLGISFFGQGTDRFGALAVGLSSAAIYVALGLGLIMGIIPDLGLFASASAPLPARLFMVVMVPVVHLLMLTQARLNRAAVIEAMSRELAAERAAAQQQSRFQEVREQLDQARAAVQGNKGHYTGTTAGRYLVGGLIGRGAMGEVYAAEEAGGGEEVAVKIMHPHLVDQAHMLERFKREGELAGRIDSPNVVRIFEAGATEDGAPFVAMELLHGRDLTDLLRERRVLEPAEALELARQVGAGLDEAHAAGVIHRDLKPQNIFRADDGDGDSATESGYWTVLDFGVSRLMESRGTLTGGGMVGTPNYMAPEQAQGKDATTASDLYSLGAVLYRALVGVPPFPGKDHLRVMYKVVQGRSVRPSAINPELNRDIDAFLAVAMAFSPDQRFNGGLELGKVMEAAVKRKLTREFRQHARRIARQRPWRLPDRGG